MFIKKKSLEIYGEGIWLCIVCCNLLRNFRSAKYFVRDYSLVEWIMLTS